MHDKVGDGDGDGDCGTSCKADMQQIDASLTRLGTDYVDLYQVHRFEPNAPVEETIEALNYVVKVGKARQIRTSSMFARQFAKMQHAAEIHGISKIVFMQNRHNHVQCTDEPVMFPLLADQGIGGLPWNPLAAGELSRPWSKSNSTRGEANPKTDFPGTPLWFDSDKPTIDAAESIANDRRVSMASIALAWVFTSSVFDAPIVGASKTHHLVDAAAVLDITFTEPEITALEEHYTLRKPTNFMDDEFRSPLRELGRPRADINEWGPRGDH